MAAFFAIVVAVTLSSVLTAAEPVEWKFVSVHDGDTLTAVDASNTQHKVRLAGIDAPETKQPFGTKARERLAELTLRKVVRCGRRAEAASIAIEGLIRRMLTRSSR